MAAGLSLPEKNVPLFRKKINELCSLTEDDLIPKITIDVPMPIHYVSRELLQEMELLKPFGKGNPRPLFAEKKLKVLNMRVLGKNKNVVKMQVADEQGYVMDGVYFGDAGSFTEYASWHPELSLVYYPTVNYYMGRETLQITVTNYQ